MSGVPRLRRPATGTSPEVAARLRRPAQHGAQPLRFALATLTAALVMTALVALTLARGVMAELVSSPLKAKLAGADRIAYYVLPEELDEAPSFRVGPSDITLKLVTHLVLPEATVFDENEDYAYGVRLHLESLDGEPLWDHEVNIRTRQSKSEGDGYGWRFENSFILDDAETEQRAREVTDDRLTRVRLPPAVVDRRLRVTFVPREPSSAVQGLARLYVRHPRPADDQALRELSLDPKVAADLVDHLTYRDWEQLSETERHQKLGFVWERMSAEGDIDEDYELLNIYYTGFRLPRHTKTDRRKLVVEPTRWLAINALGPAELGLEVFGDAPVDPAAIARFGLGEGELTRHMSPSEYASLLSVKRRGLDGRDLTFDHSRSRLQTLILPDEEVYTLIFESPVRTELTLDVIEAPPERERVWLIEADRPRRLDDEGNEVLEPDVRRIQVVRVGVNWRELPRWEIMGPPEVEATRTFRVDARVVHPAPSSWWPTPDQAPRPELELCFFDAAGEELGCEPWQGRPARESHFEGLRLGDEGDASATRWYEVSEPQTWRFVAPREAAAFSLGSPEGLDQDQRLIVRAYGYWPEVETLVGLPFREYDTDQTIWRYPPLDFRTWFPLRPVNYDALQDDAAIADLLAQVRLQPRGHGGSDGQGGRPGGLYIDDKLGNDRAGEDGWDPGPWVTLEPRGVHRRRSILEELDEEAAQRLATRWDGSLFTELWPKRGFTVDFGATGPIPPQLHWQVDPRTLGRSVKLHIDDETHEHELRETRGRWTVPVEGGRRRVRFEFDADNADYEVWLDRPVLVASPPVSRRRVIHELTNSLVFPLVKPDAEALTVNVVVYMLRRRDSAELALQIDDGQPQRREGVPIEHISLSDRSYSIDREGAFDERDRLVDEREPIRHVDLEGKNRLPLEVATLRITLGEDVVPGAHEIRVTLLDGERVWVRAFHRGVADRSKAATSWTEAAGPSEGAAPP